MGSEMCISDSSHTNGVSDLRTDKTYLDVKKEESLDKANDVIKPTSDKVQRIAPGGRKDVLDHQGYNHNKEFQGNKVITPEQQVKMKQDHSAKKKASAEVEAAARRAQYRKEGSLK